MPKIRVIKHGGFKYGVGDARRQYGKGQELLVKQKDARMLIAAKLAEEVSTQTQIGGKAAPKKTRALTAKPRASTAKTTTNRAGTRKGTYNRSDMRAK